MKTNTSTLLLASIALATSASCGSCSPVDHRVDYPTLESIGDADPLGLVWEEVEGNPLIPLPDCPTWHCLGQTDPWVIQGPRHWNIFFSAGGDRNGPVIGRGDLFADFSLFLNPSDGPILSSDDQPADAWDQYRETVSILWDQDRDRWLMWYLGYSISFFDDPGFGQIISDDEGQTRAPSPEPIYRPDPDGWDFAFITGPTIMVTSEGQWRLYYSGAGTTIGIGVLLSDDQGQTWTPYEGNPVFERDLQSWDEGVLEVSVLEHQGQFYMWYTGYLEPLDLETTPMYIGMATSPDGFEWERSPHNPVLGPNAPGTWNDLRIVSPQVILDDDGDFLLFAHGQSQAIIGRAMGQLGVWRSRPRVSSALATP